MNERRKKAYRYLLYYAMLEIRPIAWLLPGFRILNFLQWRSAAQQVRRAGVIADWLHNLAFFSAIDFERFDEEEFWQDLRGREERHPGLRLSKYKDIFERELAGSGEIPSEK